MAQNLGNQVGETIPIAESDLANLPPQIAQLVANAHVVVAPPTTGYNDKEGIASVPAGDTDTIYVNDPAKFAQDPAQVLAHEGTHLWQNSLPGPIRSVAAPDNNANPYDISGVDQERAQGRTLATLPAEQAATVVQTDEVNHANPAWQKQLQPWMQDIRDTPLSAMEPTEPDAKAVNTTPRPPDAADALRYEDQVAREIAAEDVHNPPRARSRKHAHHR